MDEEGAKVIIVSRPQTGRKNFNGAAVGDAVKPEGIARKEKIADATEVKVSKKRQGGKRAPILVMRDDDDIDLR